MGVCKKVVEIDTLPIFVDLVGVVRERTPVLKALVAGGAEVRLVIDPDVIVQKVPPQMGLDNAAAQETVVATLELGNFVLEQVGKVFHVVLLLLLHPLLLITYNDEIITGCGLYRLGFTESPTRKSSKLTPFQSLWSL